MATETRSSTTKNNNQQHREPQPEKRHRTVFEVPDDFFDSCRLLPYPSFPISEPYDASANSIVETLAAADDGNDEEQKIEQTAKNAVVPRLSCNTCKAEFDSLIDQRSHFKSDYHRFNVKLTIAGKSIVKEEDFDELAPDSLSKDYDVSSISGSDDEADKDVFPRVDLNMASRESVKQKLFIHLRTGERVSLWKCLFLSESENISFENDRLVMVDTFLRESEVVEKLKCLIHEPRNNTHLRVVLLASGGHFAGCVFDGNSVVAHKTFHRYVTRGKAGKKQSTKDASGKAASSAGASLRRYNELALKKEIQELLAAWKPYFDASSCIFISAPSNNRQLLYDGEKPYFSYQHCVVRNVPLTVKRPTLKEARRIYNQLTQVFYEVDDRECSSGIIDSMTSISSVIDSLATSKEDLGENLERSKVAEASSSCKKSEPAISSDSDSEVIGTTTPLHEAVKCGNAHKVLELLEQGLDPCIKDERGRTPYMLATEKEVRNSFRRFMASNLNMWDWIAAKVPSALTQEMEESQASKQAEKDAKKKARAKELKKLRKAREKKAQAEAALSQTATIASGATSLSVLKGQSQSGGRLLISKEEEQKRAQAAEREKRAAAAERRLAAGAALDAQGSSRNIAPGTSQPKSGIFTDIQCSCCQASLAGIVPFHRYNYKYCSTSCMHVHKQILEDG